MSLDSPAYSADLPAEHALFGGRNPVPGTGRSRSWTRSLECERLGLEEGVRRYPGTIRPAPPKGDYFERDVVVCRQRLLRAGLRAPEDEALLDVLEASTVTLVEVAAAMRPDLADATWLVDAFVINPVVGTKVAFATKNALMDRGLGVSDRRPLLGHADLDVILRMAPDDAFPTACVRWAATGALQPGDAFLAIMTLDPRETALHAGLCVDGRWAWIR